MYRKDFTAYQYRFKRGSREPYYLPEPCVVDEDKKKREGSEPYLYFDRKSDSCVTGFYTGWEPVIPIWRIDKEANEYVDCSTGKRYSRDEPEEKSRPVLPKAEAKDPSKDVKDEETDPAENDTEVIVGKIGDKCDAKNKCK